MSSVLRITLKVVLALVALLAMTALALWWQLMPPAAPEHRIFINGQVLSMDADNRVFEALSVRGERIDRLGSSAQLLLLADDNTVITDLQGKTLLPGFVDAHGHFPGSGLAALTVDLSSPPVGTVHDMAELQQRLAAKLAGKDETHWLAGFGYDDTLLTEKRHPTRDDLDAVSSTVPIYVTHVSGHMGVANSRALALLDITSASENPIGGVIVRRPGSQEPEGLLEETAHMAAVANAMRFSMLDSLRMAKAASDEYVAVGVTTAQSGGTDASMGAGLATLVEYQLIKPRLVIFPWYNQWGPQLLSGDADASSLNSDRVMIGPIKFVADGSIQGYTGYLSEPYYVPYKGDEDYRGYPAIPREDLIRIVADFHRAGFQLAIHGNGDASIDDILDAFALAQAEHPVADPRLIVIHAQMARDDQLLRMKQLGVTPSFFSAHTYYWGDRHRDIFMGPERAARMSPTKSAEAIGLRYTVHLDTPIVPMLPMQMLWSTVNRRSTSGAEIGPEQRVSVMNALRAMTIDAAWQVFQEDKIGSLEAGKFADLLILDGDPRTAADVRDLRVIETLVGGASVYRIEGGVGST